MKVKIELTMRGIHGTLAYEKGNNKYQIPIEKTGHHSPEWYVPLNYIKPEIPSDIKNEVLKEIRRELQIWAKNNDSSVSW